MTYKTAAELGITEDERTALIKTMDVLRAEALVYNQATCCALPDDTQPAHPCGTSCCIGGSMSLLMQNGMRLPARITPAMADVAASYVNEQDETGRPFAELFWANTDDATTPEHGVQAVENFLRGNTRNPWKGVGDYC